MDSFAEKTRPFHLCVYVGVKGGDDDDDDGDAQAFNALTNQFLATEVRPETRWTQPPARPFRERSSVFYAPPKMVCLIEGLIQRILITSTDALAVSCPFFFFFLFLCERPTPRND